MVIRNSAIRILTASSTPCWPLYCPNHQLPSSLVSFVATHSKSPYRHSSHKHKISTQRQCLENVTTPSHTTVECDWYFAFGNRSTISKAIECRRDALNRGVWLANRKCESVIHDLHRAVDRLWIMQSQWVFFWGC
jgi:hypothetical protein